MGPLYSNNVVIIINVKLRIELILLDNFRFKRMVRKLAYAEEEINKYMNSGNLDRASVSINA